MSVCSLSHKMCLQFGQITGLLSARFFYLYLSQFSIFPSHLENGLMYLLKLYTDCWFFDATLFLMMNWRAMTLMNYIVGEKEHFPWLVSRGDVWTASSAIWWNMDQWGISLVGASPDCCYMVVGSVPKGATTCHGRKN